MTERQRKIEVVPYDPHWPDLFAEEAAAIRGIGADCFLAVHHIGSTSVPGLVAKPVIDLMLEVSDLTELEGYDGEMEGLGYVVKGEYGIPGRRFYLKGVWHRTHHVHAFLQGSSGLTRHLAFRDYLRAHPEDAAEYGALKFSNAAKFPHDMDGYCEAKHDYVTSLEQRAVRWASVADGS
ncbi:MAG: GrpB family protein [Verrucomicrobiales bacterium]